MRKLAWVATWVAAACLVAGCAARAQTGKPAADQRKPQKAAAGGEERGKPEQTPLSQKAKQPLAQSQKYKLGNREQEAKAMFNKGLALYEDLKKPEEAIAAYDEVARRFEDAAEPAIRETAAMAMVKKGLALYLLNRYGEARKAFEQAAQRGYPEARRALELLTREGH